MRIAFIILAIGCIASSCGSDDASGLFPATDVLHQYSDSTPPSHDSESQDDGHTPGSGADTVDNDDTSETDEAPALRFAFMGPSAKTLHTEEVADLFCFSLMADGDDMSVYLPKIEIHAIDGGKVVTHPAMRSGNGQVFIRPELRAGDLTVVDGVGLDPDGTETVAVLTPFSQTRILLKDNSMQTFCIRATVTSDSLTPSDYSGHQYRVVMHDWDEASVTYHGEAAFLPRDQIFAPNEQLGNVFTIKASDDTPAPYSGSLEVLLNPNVEEYSFGQTDAFMVRVLPILFSADGNGACVQSLKITRTGVAQDSDFQHAELFDNTSGAEWPVLEPESFFEDGTVTFESADGLTGIFCVEGGETRSMIVTVGIEVDATDGAIFRLSIASASDVVRAGDAPVSGTFPIVSGDIEIYSPNHQD